MDINGLLFDGDDVLYDATMWRRWLLQLLGKMGLHTHYHAFYRVWERDYLPAVNEGRADFWEALRNYLLSAGLTSGQADEVIAASHAKYRQFQQNLRPLPGVLATIARLNATGVPMAVLNNAPCSAHRAEQMLANIGLAGSFSVLTSFDLGMAKPAPECYRSAVASLGLDEVCEVAFVGHDAIELAGAANIGMRTIAVNYDPDASADVYLDSFDRLASVIRFRSPRLLAG